MKTTSWAVAVLVLAGCAATSHRTKPAALGTAKSSDDLVAVVDQPGTLELVTVDSADWAVDRAGLINLEHPTAKKEGLKAGDEPISIFFHVIRHPTRGTFIVDTGVEKAMRDAPAEAALSGVLVSSFFQLDKMKYLMPLGDWLAQERKAGRRLDGVFLTHLHSDHVSGMRDVPKGTPIFNGPGEADETGMMNLVAQGITDKALEGQDAISEWQFKGDASGRFSGVLDVFGDGQLWAIQVPGHTVGSTAYVVRTANGPVLLTGDTCHTVWGWEHDVEPGSFTADHAKNAAALAALRKLAAEHPTMQVRMGHQMPAAK